jgi:hypothetical protein
MIRLRANAAHWRGVAAGVAALVAAGALGWLYFTAPGAAGEEWVGTDGFYGRWRTEWVRRDAADYESVIRTAKPDRWASMVIRTAMTRWRLWDDAPELWQNLMMNYARGSLGARDKEFWTRFMRGWDGAWHDLRGRAEKAGKVIHGQGPEMISRPEDGLLILHFPAKVRTVQVGTMIRLVVDAPPGTEPAPEASVYWQTKQMLGTVPERRLLALMHEVPGAPAGLKRFAMDIDLSSEPAWLAPQAEPQRFFIRTPHTERWQPVGVEFGTEPPKTSSAQPSP